MSSSERQLDRRRFLGTCGASIGLAIVGPSQGRADEVPAIVDWLLREAAVEGRERAARYLRGGGDEQVLLDAVGVAAAAAIPGSESRYNHIVLAAHSVRQLIHGMPGGARRLRCLWLVRAFHHERDRLAAAWRQPPHSPRVVNGDAAAPLRAALESWDADAADRAVVDLVAARGAEAALGVVRPFGMRCQANLGHKVIHLAAIESLLPRLAEAQRLPVLRAFVSGCCLHGRTARAGTFAVARELAHAPARAATGPASAVSEAMRLGDADKALHAMAVAGPAGAGDAVLVHAAEVTLARLGVAPLHATTSAVALADLARSHAGLPDGELARLQSAAFQAWFRADAGRPEGASAALESTAAAPWPEGGSVLARALRAAATPAVGALPGILALPPLERATLVREFGHHMVARAFDLHQVKLAAAVLTTLPHVGEFAGAALLAAALLHAPAAEGPSDSRLDELQRLLENG